MMRDISEHACLEVKIRVSGSQIWLQQRTAKISAGTTPTYSKGYVTLLVSKSYVTLLVSKGYVTLLVSKGYVMLF